MEQETLVKRLRRRYIWALVLIVVVVGLVVALVLYFRSSDNTGVSNQKTCNGTIVAGKCQTTSSTSKPSTKSPVVSSKSGSAPNSSGSQSSSTSTTSPLSNTGPGNIVGLFVGTVIVGSLVHYIYVSHRRAKT